MNRENILVVDALNTLLSNHNHNCKPSQLPWVYLGQLRDAILETGASRVILCSDAGESHYRMRLLPSYKSDRKRKREKEKKENPARYEAFQKFLTAAQAFLSDWAHQLGLEVITVPGVEADDLIAYLVNHADLERYRVAVLSSDTDLLQLLRPGVVQRSTLKTMGLKPTEVKLPARIWCNLKRFKEAYNISPEQFVWMKAIAGDSGDSIPGVAGVGENLALKMMVRYGSIEEVKRNVHKLEIPRLRQSARQSMIENFDAIYETHKLVNLLHTPEQEQQIIGAEGIARLERILATLDDPPQVNDDFLREKFLAGGRVNEYRHCDKWVKPFKGIHI